MAPKKMESIPAEQQRQIEDLSRRIFQLSMMFTALRQKSRTQDPYDLTESEFLTLDALAEKHTCTVGELQRKIGVLPAQMSRIIRSLETKADKPLIQCSINPDDKRKINVTLTELGRREHRTYQQRPLVSPVSLISALTDQQRRQLEDIVETMRKYMEQQV